ncbi:MAG: hypothetical protein IJW59_00320 [Clostridia bacterium]|nr:hypothetical protein [Clostridia bacterium]
MVSARLSYRNHRPYGYFAIETSNLHFFGDENLTYLLNKLKNLIEYDKNDESEIKIEKLSGHKQANFNEWLKWQQEIKSFKKEHLFWMLSRELREEMSILQAECDKLGANDEHLRLAIAQLEDNKMYSAVELTIKFTELLTELGFTCKTATRTESNLHEETYESTCSDDELKTRVQNMIAGLEKIKIERESALANRYSQVDIIDSEEIFEMD